MPKLPCDYINCSDVSDDTSLVVRDSMGIRILCSSHWDVMTFLFKNISNCSRSDKEFKCIRNHLGDLEEDARNNNSVKYDGKYWNLCSAHLSWYERLLDLFLSIY